MLTLPTPAADYVQRLAELEKQVSALSIEGLHKPKRLVFNPAYNANRVLGDWAEEMTIRSFISSGLEAMACGVNDIGPITDELKARVKEEWGRIGKRPDILVGPAGQPLSLTVGGASLAIESRASARLSQDMYQATKKKGESLSITLKVEDIIPQSRWALSLGIPLIIAQVLLAPEVWAITWADALRYVLNNKPTKDRKSDKYTFFIPFEHPSVVRLGVAQQAEDWSQAESVIDESGKLSVYAKPAGRGIVTFSQSALDELAGRL